MESWIVERLHQTFEIPITNEFCIKRSEFPLQMSRGCTWACLSSMVGNLNCFMIFMIAKVKKRLGG